MGIEDLLVVEVATVVEGDTVVEIDIKAIQETLVVEVETHIQNQAEETTTNVSHMDLNHNTKEMDTQDIVVTVGIINLV